ncbi:MAG: glycosyltransferase [Planctomycetaceae bacterium]|nr:glycosyltransferase [Planctomycetaceae bacterium]
MLRLLQICNVGNIVGGTAACAWSVVRALPDCRHHVVLRSQPTQETTDCFMSCSGVERVDFRRRMSRAEIRSLRPEVILLHNIGSNGVELPPEIPAIQYVHSNIRPLKASVEMNCSQWLAQKRGKDDSTVCWQGVPLSKDESSVRESRTELVIGRICTPTDRKWPAELLPFYKELARRYDEVAWEFVGCPVRLKSSLSGACRGRARFLEAGWQARKHLARWDLLLYHHPDLTESFGRTVTEAMRVGTIPVVDNRGGFVEQVMHEVGFLCHHQAEFMKSIEQLRDEKIRGRMSAMAQEWANQQWSMSAFRERLLSWFAKL